ncbi:MAG: cyclic nucleotide-binding domain-containing protein, partial [Gemmatimonadales bacterium]
MTVESREAALQNLAVLEFLPADVRELVTASFVPASFTFGQEIVREGEPADALYVLVSGRARVLKKGEGGDELSLGALRPGDTFGEAGLLERAVHPATVRASSDIEVLRLDRSVFDALLRERTDVRHYLELQNRNRHLQHFFRQFNVFTQLPPEALAELLAGLEPVTAESGEVIIREGDPPGPLYILEDGRCRVHIGMGDRRRNVAFIRQGEFFGELSVFRGHPREATVEAVAPCRLLRLTRELYADLLERYPNFRESIEERIEQYDFRHTAQIPIDFYREMLPADATVQEKVGESQVDQTVEMRLPEPGTPAPPRPSIAAPG